MKLVTALTLSLSISLASLVGCAASGTDDGEGSAAALSGTPSGAISAPARAQDAANKAVWESMRYDMLTAYAAASTSDLTDRTKEWPNIDGFRCQKPLPQGWKGKVYELKKSPATSEQPLWTKAEQQQLAPSAFILEGPTNFDGLADLDFFLVLKDVLSPCDPKTPDYGTILSCTNVSLDSGPTAALCGLPPK